MKYHALMPLSLLMLPLILRASEIRPGDHFSTVQATLGEPRGRLQTEARELLYYDRGEVELSRGRVTRVALRSEQDQAAFETQRANEARRAREENALTQARLVTEGTALKARKLSDRAFQTSPLAYQITFWENFSRQYPEVPCAEELSLARARYAEQTAQAELQQRRLAELEARVAETEARAAAAQRRAAHPHTYYPFSAFPYGDHSHRVSHSRPRHRHDEHDERGRDCPPERERADDPTRRPDFSRNAISPTPWAVWDASRSPAGEAPRLVLFPRPGANNLSQ